MCQTSSSPSSSCQQQLAILNIFKTKRSGKKQQLATHLTGGPFASDFCAHLAQGAIALFSFSTALLHCDQHYVQLIFHWLFLPATCLYTLFETLKWTRDVLQCPKIGTMGKKMAPLMTGLDFLIFFFFHFFLTPLRLFFVSLCCTLTAETGLPACLSGFFWWTNEQMNEWIERMAHKVVAVFLFSSTAGLMMLAIS